MASPVAGEGRERTQTFALDDDDDDLSESPGQSDPEGEELGPGPACQRLSFVFEHNTLFATRIASLTKQPSDGAVVQSIGSEGEIPGQCLRLEHVPGGDATKGTNSDRYDSETGSTLGPPRRGSSRQHSEDEDSQRLILQELREARDENAELRARLAALERVVLQGEWPGPPAGPGARSSCSGVPAGQGQGQQAPVDDAGEVDTTTRLINGARGSVTSLAEVGSAAISELSGAISSLFGGFGVASSAGHEWASEPLSRNVALSGDRQTASFLGEDKDELHAFVCTSEPPRLDDGYGFEVTVGMVREGRRDEIAIGFTALAPSDWPEELPETADGLGEAWLVGYDGEMWCSGVGWVKVPWSPPALQEGDRVGVLATFSGHLEVLLNGEAVWTTDIPLTQMHPPLYGIVDLLGCVDEVSLVA